MTPNKVLDKSFAQKIELLAIRENLTIMDAIIHYCDAEGIEIDAIASIVKRAEPLRVKLEAQCRAANLLREPPAPTLSEFVS